MQANPTFSPLDADTSQTLLFHLNNSISPESHAREAALAWLQACEGLPGFLYSLVEVVGARELPITVRTQAVLYFKNCLEKYWRRGAKHGVDAQSKTLIRHRLLTLLDEQDRAIAKTLALCVGKLARLDYDREWPDLFDRLLTSMQEAIQAIEQGHAEARLILHRALLDFQQAVKALSTNRTMAGKFLMGRLCEKAFPILSELYHNIFNSSIYAFSSSQLLPSIPLPGQPLDLELSLLTLKILSKLVVYGWGGAAETPERKAEFIEIQKHFFVSSMQDFTTLYGTRAAVLSNGANADALAAQSRTPTSPLFTLNAHLMAYGKMYHALLHQNHIIFHGLGRTRDLVRTYWNFVQEASQSIQTANLDDPASLHPLKFLMQALIFVKLCFTQFPTADASFKDDSFATECTECIILRLLPLRQPDLEKWEADPEEWIKEEDEEKWKFDVRPCAEAFLKELMKAYGHVIYQVNEYRLHYQDATEFHDVLIKEAVYAAISHSSAEFSNTRDDNQQLLLEYGPWLQSKLIPEAAGTDKAGLIIRRRIAAIAGNWIASDTSPEAQSSTYALIMHLLQQNASTDLAVRLTAATSLGQCDAWDNDVVHFLPFLEQSLVQLSSILQEVEYPEIKMKLNDVLGDVIVRAGHHIAAHLPRLMDIIPQLWQVAHDDFTKQAIVATFKKLVDALGAESQVLHPAVQDFVKGCCDPDSPSHVVLQDDGLELWRSTLRFATSPSTELLSLAPLSTKLLRGGTDILPKVLRIIESYILLQPDAYLSIHAQDLLNGFSHLLASLNDKATKPLLYTTDMIIQSAPAAIWAPALDGSGLVLHMVRTIVSDSSATPVTRFLPTLARIAIADIGAFRELLVRAATQLGLPTDEVIRKVLMQWLDRYDNLSYAAQRKLVALALSNFVQTANPNILDRIDEIITVWLSALGETEESISGEYVNAPYGDGAAKDVWQEDEQQHAFEAIQRGQPIPHLRINIGRTEPWAGEARPLSTSSFDPSASLCSTAGSSRSSSITVSTDRTSAPASPGNRHHMDMANGISEHWEDAAANLSRCHASGNGQTAAPSLWDLAADCTDLTSSSYSLHRYAGASKSNNDTSNLSLSSFLLSDPFAHLDETFHAGRHHDSADCYYRNDEQDEEAILDRGWEDADGWGAEPAETGVPEDGRLKNLAARDPLHTVKLSTAISAALNHTAEMNGGMVAFHTNWLAPPKVAQNVLDEFQQWLSGVAHGGD